jgi:hypothetical protein
MHVPAAFCDVFTGISSFLFSVFHGVRCIVSASSETGAFGVTQGAAIRASDIVTVE